MAESVDHVLSQEVGNCILRHNFRHSCMYKQPMLSKQWNYNIFAQIFHSSLSYINRLLAVFFFLVTVTLSEFHDKPRRKDRVTEKVYRWKIICHDGSPYHKETNQLIGRANYWQNIYRTKWFNILESQFIGNLELFWTNKILVSTLNIVGGILCGDIIISERWEL